jgi:hypothetical protein
MANGIDDAEAIAPEPDDAQAGRHRLRNRLVLVGMFAMVFGPMFFARFLYDSGAVSGGATNHGELLDPVQPVQALSAELPAQPGLWSMALRVDGDCSDVACRDALHMLRQLHVLLNRDAGRVQRVLVSEAAEPVRQALAADYPRLRMVAPAGGRLAAGENAVFLVDPLGNVVMRYRLEQIGEELLDDLERLLKLSGIG